MSLYDTDIKAGHRGSIQKHERNKKNTMSKERLPITANSFDTICLKVKCCQTIK